MNVKDKIREHVDVLPFTALTDFAADESLTLAAYHFTGPTSDLLTMWLDKLHAGGGHAVAVAAERGAGKSHFLSMLSILSTRHQLSQTIADEQVRRSSERLEGRNIRAVRLWLGKKEGLREQLQQAVYHAFGIDGGGEIRQLLASATQAIGDGMLMIVIDAFRDTAAPDSPSDGEDDLAEIAQAVREQPIFAALAVDADLRRSGFANIPGGWAAAYLDKEHLNQVIAAQVFRKKPSASEFLRGFHAHCRRTFQGFPWSEERFAALYPLHPVVMELAPIIRSDDPEFCVLAFASTVGAKIQSRPAHSLIGLDELFDWLQPRVASISSMAASVETYDKCDREIVQSVSLRQRLIARLILRAWFMLSLRGRGPSAEEIAASLMLENQNDFIDDLIKRFEAVANASAVSPIKAETTSNIPDASDGEPPGREFTAEQASRWAELMACGGAELSDAIAAWYTSGSDVKALRALQASGGEYLGGRRWSLLRPVLSAYESATTAAEQCIHGGGDAVNAMESIARAFRFSETWFGDARTLLIEAFAAIEPTITRRARLRAASTRGESRDAKSDEFRHPRAALSSLDDLLRSDDWCLAEIGRARSTSADLRRKTLLRMAFGQACELAHPGNKTCVCRPVAGVAGVDGESIVEQLTTAAGLAASEILNDSTGNFDEDAALQVAASRDSC